MFQDETARFLTNNVHMRSYLRHKQEIVLFKRTIIMSWKSIKNESSQQHLSNIKTAA